MNTRLNRIPSWLDVGQEANWSVIALAKKSGVSVRTLERYFCEKLGRPPKIWLVEERQRQAIKLVIQGLSIKQIATRLGYRYAHHFSRDFKAFWGFCPSTKAISDMRDRLRPSERSPMSDKFFKFPNRINFRA